MCGMSLHWGNLLCCCICFAFFFAFVPGTTSALVRTFTRQQYLLYAPRKKAKNMRKNWENKAGKKMKKRQTRTRTVAFLFALPFAFFGFRCFINFFGSLYLSMAGAPDISPDIG